jgi:hypothetical protein
MRGWFTVKKPRVRGDLVEYACVPEWQSHAPFPLHGNFTLVYKIVFFVYLKILCSV